MPKPKPDKVIRHEVVLGRSERDMLEPLFATLSAKNLITPLVALLSDMSALYALVTIYEVVTGKETGIPTPNDATEFWESLHDWIKQQRAEGAAVVPTQAQLSVYVPGIAGDILRFLESIGDFQRGVLTPDDSDISDLV